VRFSVLASGSTGNASLIETKDHKILMDAGLSGKKIKALLAAVGVNIKDIDLVFLSHDHADHSSGLGVLLRRYPQINAYANSGTWQYLLDTNKIGKIPVQQMNMIEPGQSQNLGDLEVTAFATSHDAAEPQYYVFSSGGQRLVCLTDTGYVSEKVKAVISDADAYLMEFNYDDQMLRNGPYSWQLKQRILSDHGHLSNDQAAQVLLDVISLRTKFLFLAHRSQKNNRPELARKTAIETLTNNGVDLSQLEIIDTSPDTPTGLIEI
jgi:phosphoribosyl 1,2-cyclic phosphodiesterase